MNGKLFEVIDKIPVVNLVPMFAKMASDFPARWEALPEERKQALFEALVAAGTKAAASYASK